jgi:hypothetical protein
MYIHTIKEEEGKMELGAKREGEERKVIHMWGLNAYLNGEEMDLVAIIYLLFIRLNGDAYVCEG